jgi:thermostable 8-oxoguanine DNA glycosylase
MIDPKKITNYNRTDAQLEEFLLFCIMVAGHNAQTTAKTLERLLVMNLDRPFEFMRIMTKVLDKISPTAFNMWLATYSVGCYNRVARTIKELLYRKLDLRMCSVEDLESIHGIGPKTARFFITHSRQNQRFAILDVHILAFMREKGIDTPKSTPSGKKYAILEKEFLKMVDASGMSPADFDLMIWKSRAANG